MLANIFLYEDDLDSEASGCGGLVCVFSLKNPAHPEYSCAADSGVMSLHFHPGHPPPNSVAPQIMGAQLGADHCRERIGSAATN